MIQAIIRISVPPEKIKEVVQTFQALLGPIRHEPGCIGCNCYLDAETQNDVCLVEEWQSTDDLNAHLRSVFFAVLTGAMDLFVKEPDIRFHTITSTTGPETILAAQTPCV